MIETKNTRSDITQVEQKSLKRIRLEEFFKNKYPKAFEVESRQLQSLENYNSKIILKGPDEIFLISNLINEKALLRGYDHAYIDPYNQLPASYVPFNCLSIPLQYIGTLYTLEFKFANRDKGRAFTEKGLELMIEGQRQLFMGSAFEKFKDFYRIEEELENPDLAMKERIKLGMDLMASSYHLSRIASDQFVKKIKNDRKRDFIDDIATVETFINILNSPNVISGLEIDNENFEYLLNARYPGPIFDETTLKKITKKAEEIRKGLKESY